MGGERGQPPSRRPGHRRLEQGEMLRMGIPLAARGRGARKGAVAFGLLEQRALEPA